MKLGTVLHYRLTKADEQAITLQRLERNMQGSLVRSGEWYPMMVTHIHEDGAVNGKVFLDGTDSIWVQDVVKGRKRGNWLALV